MTKKMYYNWPIALYIMHLFTITIYNCHIYVLLKCLIILVRLSPVYVTNRRAKRKGGGERKGERERKRERYFGCGQLEARTLVSPVRSPFQMGP